MNRGRTVTREIKLRNLQTQGMDYYANDKNFFCRHCKMYINSPELQKATQHVSSLRHTSNQERMIQLEKQEEQN